LAGLNLTTNKGYETYLADLLYLVIVDYYLVVVQ